MVPNQKSEDIAEKVRKTIEEACPKSIQVEVEIKGGGDPYVVIPPGKPGSTGQESTLMKKAFPILEDCVQQQFGTKPIYLVKEAVFLLSVIYEKWQDLKH